MIVDCHTHIWDAPAQLGTSINDSDRLTFGSTAGRENELPVATTDRHFDACEHVDVTIVAGFKSRYLGAEIANEQVAAYVRQHPDRLVGFAGIDPSDSKAAVEALGQAHGELGMVGAAVAPAAQDFHPSDSKAMLVYQTAAELGMPILFHTGIRQCRATKLEFARPLLLDEVAREIPELRLLVAQVGWPWVSETLALLAKHPNVYAEISGILQQPWRAYQMLLEAYQSGVMHKLLFGSGFPFAIAAHCIEAIYDINHICRGTNLPAIPGEELRRMVERNSLDLLGIEMRRSSVATPPPSASLLSDETEMSVTETSDS